MGWVSVKEPICQRATLPINMKSLKLNCRQGLQVRHDWCQPDGQSAAVFATKPISLHLEFHKSAALVYV